MPNHEAPRFGQRGLPYASFRPHLFMSAEKSLNSSLKVCQRRRGVAASDSAPLSTLSRVLSRRRRSSVGSSRCGCWWWCHCRWGLQRAERTRPSGSAIIRRVALEVFGNHELPHIHAAVEGTDRRCWGRPKVCDEGVTSGCCLVGNISAGVASNPGGGRSHQ